MENVGLIGAVGIGVVVALTPPVLVWAVVVKGLRQVTDKRAHNQRHNDVQPGTADA